MTVPYEFINDYRDFLNDVHEPVEICGYKYDAATALERVDPIAFRVGLADYISWVEDHEVQS